MLGIATCRRASHSPARGGRNHMNWRIAQLQSQHEACLAIVGDIQTRSAQIADRPSAVEITLMLARLTGILRIHLALEDEILYPALRNHQGPRRSRHRRAVLAGNGRACRHVPRLCRSLEARGYAADRAGAVPQRGGRRSSRRWPIASAASIARSIRWPSGCKARRVA